MSQEPREPISWQKREVDYVSEIQSLKAELAQARTFLNQAAEVSNQWAAECARLVEALERYECMSADEFILEDGEAASIAIQNHVEFKEKMK